METDWNPTNTAEVGVLCEIRIRDPFGTFDLRGPYFLHDDGNWYLVEPPTKIEGRVVAWREYK